MQVCRSAVESDEEPDEGGQVEAPPGIEIPDYPDFKSLITEKHKTGHVGEEMMNRKLSPSLPPPTQIH